jgi:hypothetical protein
MHQRSAAILATIVLAACSGEVALTPPSSTTGSGGASTFTTTSGSGGEAPLAITGTLIDTWRTDGGDVLRPRGSAEASVSALVQRDDGGWDSYPGTLDDAGHFIIPDVPLGTAHVLVRGLAGDDGVEMRVTAERTLALGRRRWGRPDAAHPAKPAPIQLQVTGGASWDLASSTEAVESIGGDFEASGKCSDGLDGCVLGSASGGLIDASKGDRTWYLHRARSTSGTDTASWITHAFSSTTFSQQDGVTATLSGAAAPVPQRHLALTYDVAAFEALLDDLPPGLTCDSLDVTVAYTAPGQLALGELVRDGLGDGALDMIYGDLLPAGAAPSAWVCLGTSALSVPDPVVSGSSMHLNAVFCLRGAASALALQTVKPTLSAPREIRVNGQDALAGVHGAGASPVLTWKAPLVGESPLYYVFAWSYPGPGVALDAYTRDTQLVIPAEVLAMDNVRFYVAAQLGDDAADLEALASISTAGGFTR